MRLALAASTSLGERIRLLLITNKTTPGADPGLRVAYERMLREGEIAMLETAAPSVTTARHGEAAAASELLDVGRHRQPNVVLVHALSGVKHYPPFVRRVLGSLGDPALLCWQGDPWQRWRKPLTASMRAWLGAADLVFTPARRPQSDLLKRAGARDVRFMPQTYNYFQIPQGGGNRSARW